MTKSNNEWVPVVGGLCEAFNYDLDTWLTVKVLDGETGYGEHPVLAFEKDRGGLLFWAIKFREIKTEAEKRRDEAVEELFQKLYADDSNDIWTVAENIIDAGWIKPKPLTDNAIQVLILKHQTDCETLCSFEFARMVEAYIMGKG